MREPHIIRLQQEYRDIHPVATHLAETLVNELRHLIKRDGISLAVPIEHRVKTWDSIELKFARADRDGRHIPFSGASLSDLSDLIGLRVIVLFQRDLAQVRKLLESTFRVVDTEDKGENRAVDRFGYSSVHYQLRMPESWITVPTFKAFEAFQIEVQVRTLAQHMWAAASHVLQYKQEGSVPEHMRRAIYRISSLLELVDAEYEHLLTQRDQYRSQVRDDEHLRRLNTDVLEAILDAQLPRQNKAGYEPYSMLVWELEKLGIASSESLERLIAQRLEHALEQDNDRSFFTHTGLLNLMLEAEYGVGFHSKIFDKVEEEMSLGKKDST
jgi:putative GTP pyrophosphokinase